MAINWQSVFSIDRNLRKRKLWLGLGFLLIAVIVYSSLVSNPQMPEFQSSDKVMHFVGYWLLMGWWVQMFRHKTMRVILMLSFILLGICIEVMQSFHPLRYFDTKDMLANSLGVGIAWLMSFTAFDQLLVKTEKLVF